MLIDANGAWNIIVARSYFAATSERESRPKLGSLLRSLGQTCILKCLSLKRLLRFAGARVTEIGNGFSPCFVFL